MGALEPGHLIVILAIVLIIFGPGKLTEIGGQLGRGIREFRETTEGKDAPKAISGGARYCARCGSAASLGDTFCARCGHALDGAA